jgi:hypothetical protein
MVQNWCAADPDPGCVIPDPDIFYPRYQIQIFFHPRSRIPPHQPKREKVSCPISFCSRKFYVLPLYGGLFTRFLLLTFTVRHILSHFTFLFFRRFTLLSFFSFLVKLSAPYEFFMVGTLMVSFHQRPQRPGRSPRGPPLFPPLGGAVRTGPGWPPLVLWLPRPPRCWPRG